MLTLALATLAGCGPRGEAPRERTPRAPGGGTPAIALPLDARADTALRTRLEIEPPARAFLTRVSATPIAPADGAAPPLPTPEPAPPPRAAPPSLAIDDDLRPPLLLRAAPLARPRGAAAGTVELDVRVDETGAVSDAAWAGGSADSALVAAAIACAEAMRFAPATRAGRPVAVWCRQRFEFAGR